MYGPIEKAMILIGLTHGMRVLGRLTGPRLCAMLVAMPCSTAIVLIGCGRERGILDAAAMAEASLLGLIAAVALPLAYAHALGRGWRLHWALGAAFAGYSGMAWVFSRIPSLEAWQCLCLCFVAILAACRLADRIPAPDDTRNRIAPSSIRTLVLRTAIPVVCLFMVTAARDAVGARWAGFLSTFPGMTLAVLVISYLEAGPVEASRMARSLPLGNLSMVAFLAAFRFGCPAIGLGWGSVCGYAAALTVLLGVVRQSRPPKAPPARSLLRADAARRYPIRPPWERLRRPRLPRARRTVRRRRPRPSVRFAPRVEFAAF
jgi:hypothetical protein